jgi:hypothetical protein
MRLAIQRLLAYDVHWMVFPDVIVAYNQKPDTEFTIIALSLAATKRRI